MFEDMDTVGLVVAQHDGEWYVSPISTYSEALLSVMRAIDRDEFEAIFDAFEDGSLEAWLNDELENLFGEQFEEMWESTELDSDVTDDDLGPYLATLVVGCQAGDMADCDDLYWASDVGSEEERIALTCGGTVEEGSVSGGDCATGEPTFSGDGPAAYGDDPQLDSYWDGCQAGDMTACDDLFWNSGFDTEYEAFAETCGGRIEDTVFGGCVAELGEQVG
jgi:hypothetical protein